MKLWLIPYYTGYIDADLDTVYLAYVQSQADTLYAQVAAQAVLEQLVEKGYTPAQAAAYLQTEEGKAMVAQAVGVMTEEQKQQIIAAAAANLTDEQKAQIKAGALALLTDEQKTQIKNGYIEQIMKSEEVTDQITAAVAAVSTAAANVAELKGRLDNYRYFYEGLKEYKSAVSSAATGADTLNINMDTLYKNVGALKASVGELSDGAKALSDGINQLKDGTGKFAERTSDADTVVSALVSSISGSDAEITSFVSEKNINVDAVQFVIKTEAIEITEAEDTEPVVEEKLNFWQKLLRLFGLY